MEDAEKTIFTAGVACLLGTFLIPLVAWHGIRSLKAWPKSSQSRQKKLPALSEFAQCQMDTKGCLIEQLVPEVTYYLLSYLDHRSLCSVSITSSTMRRLANDDRVWKHLFHVVSKLAVALLLVKAASSRLQCH
jgi:hypothetical protein